MRALVVRITITVVALGIVAIWVLGETWTTAAGALVMAFGEPFVQGWCLGEERLRDLTGIGARTARQRAVELEKRVQDLELALARYRAVYKEEAELRVLGTLPPIPGWRCVIARVIARDPVTWHRRFRISKGSRDGISEGAAVLAGGSVIGRISECTAGTAVVTTIADPACRLSVLVGQSNVPGILIGQEKQVWRQKAECAVDFLPVDAKYRLGDLARTSGMGMTVPGGLAVGCVTGKPGLPAANIIDGAYARVRIDPLTDFARIAHVAVVVGAPPSGPTQQGIERND